MFLRNEILEVAPGRACCTSVGLIVSRRFPSGSDLGRDIIELNAASKMNGSDLCIFENYRAALLPVIRVAALLNCDFLSVRVELHTLSWRIRSVFWVFEKRFLVDLDRSNSRVSHAKSIQIR